jgi:hypothetical protein
MPERCGEVTYGKTFCISHDTCGCGMPMAHDGECPPMSDKDTLSDAEQAALFHQWVSEYEAE